MKNAKTGQLLAHHPLVPSRTRVGSDEHCAGDPTAQGPLSSLSVLDPERHFGCAQYLNLLTDEYGLRTVPKKKPVIDLNDLYLLLYTHWVLDNRGKRIWSSGRPRSFIPKAKITTHACKQRWLPLDHFPSLICVHLERRHPIFSLFDHLISLAVDDDAFEANDAQNISRVKMRPGEKRLTLKWKRGGSSGLP